MADEIRFDQHKSRWSFFSISRYGYYSTTISFTPIPRTVLFADLSAKLQAKFKNAGVRKTEHLRSVAEAESLYLQLPRSARVDQQSVSTFLTDKDASHLVAHGGNTVNKADGFNELNASSNLIWEHKRPNRQRGSRDMTKTELDACVRSNELAGRYLIFQGSLKAGLIGGLLGAGMEIPISVLDQLIETDEVSLTRVAKDGAVAGIVSGCSSACMYLLLSLLPDRIVESEALSGVWRALAVLGCGTWAVAITLRTRRLLVKRGKSPSNRVLMTIVI